MAKRLLVSLLVACALIVFGVIVERTLVTHATDSAGSSERSGALTSNAGQHSMLAAALEIDGQVERRSPGGAWQLFTMGSNLEISDEVRTGPGARARLQLGPQVTVELADNTSVNVAQLSETLSRIRLDDGRVISEVRASKGFRFRVQVQGNNGQAEASEGRFGVMRRGNAPAVFAAEQGSVEVTGAGESVTLRTGELTQVVDGAAPSPPTKLPTSLLLKLGQPPPSRIRTKQVHVTGETSPFASVTVNNHLVVPNPSGNFADIVALVDGPNEIVVQVEDVAGRRQTQKFPGVTVDSKAPNVAGKVVW